MAITDLIIVKFIQTREARQMQYRQARNQAVTMYSHTNCYDIFSCNRWLITA